MANYCNLDLYAEIFALAAREPEVAQMNQEAEENATEEEELLHSKRHIQRLPA